MTHMRWQAEPAQVGPDWPEASPYSSWDTRTSGVPWRWSRLAAALVVLATLPIGAKASAGLHLTVMVAILAAMLALDSPNQG